MPPELTAILLAEAWHMPPWEIMEHEDSAYWASRYFVYKDELRKAQEK
jgi:hypothetical protein